MKLRDRGRANGTARVSRKLQKGPARRKREAGGRNRALARARAKLAGAERSIADLILTKQTKLDRRIESEDMDESRSLCVPAGRPASRLRRNRYRINISYPETAAACVRSSRRMRLRRISRPFVRGSFLSPSPCSSFTRKHRGAMLRGRDCDILPRPSPPPSPYPTTLSLSPWRFALADRPRSLGSARVSNERRSSDERDSPPRSGVSAIQPPPPLLPERESTHGSHC